MTSFGGMPRRRIILYTRSALSRPAGIALARLYRWIRDVKCTELGSMPDLAISLNARRAFFGSDARMYMLMSVLNVWPLGRIPATFISWRRSSAPCRSAAPLRRSISVLYVRMSDRRPRRCIASYAWKACVVRPTCPSM